MIEKRQMTKPVTGPAEADAWLDWVQRHYGLVGSSVEQVRGGWKAVAYLPEPEEPQTSDSAAQDADNLGEQLTLGW
ncbi:hypothetical protein [Amycolatopsis sp. NPDC054798]